MNYTNIEEEYLKCLLDETRIYMIENFLKTMDSNLNKMVPFKLFPRQKDYLTGLSQHQNNISTKPRQSGITTVTAAKLGCEVALAGSESTQRILLVANKLTQSKDFLRKIKEFIEQLPRWFWGSDYYHPDPKHENNTKSIYTICNQQDIELVNGCVLRATSSGPNAARGFPAATWVCFDECAFIENGSDVAASCIATTNTSGANGHVVMISTPNGQDKLYYETFIQAKAKKNNYHITEFRWYQDPRFNKHLKWFKDVSKELEDGTEVIEKIWIEEDTIDDEGNINYDIDRWWELEAEGWKPRNEWYKRTCNTLNNNLQKIAQELDVSFLGSDFNVVSPDVIMMHEKINVKNEEGDFEVDKVTPEIWIWKPPIEGHNYIMGIDASRGDSEDSSTFEIIDLDAVDDNGFPCIEQVVEFQGKVLGDVVGSLAYTYAMMYNQAFVVVDCIGGYGDLAVNSIQNMGYRNLYIDDPKIKDFTANLDYNPNDATDRTPGFKTGAVRTQMLINFANALTNNEIKIRSIRVVNELRTWIYKNGRPDHKDGSHDDTITNLAMIWFIYQFSYTKIKKTLEKDKAMLNAWKCVGSNNRQRTNNTNVVNPKMDMTNKNTYSSPFYNQKMLDKKNKKETWDTSNNVWLFYKNNKR